MTIIKRTIFKALLACLLCAVLASGASAAARFWVGGTGTWDGSNAANWSATSGGGSCSASPPCIPTSSDTVTIDANSGAGTITVAVTVDVQSITCGAMGMTLDFANNNVNLSAAFNCSGIGSRTITAGTGTWTLSGGTGTQWNMGTTTNLSNPTTAFASATLNFTNTAAGSVTIQTGGLTYGTITRSANVRGTTFITTGAPTITNLTISAPSYATFSNSVTASIGTLTISGASSSSLVGLSSDSHDVQATLSLTNAPTLSWVSSRGIAYTGAGSGFTASNSFNLGRNTGATFSPPSAGAAVGICVGC